MFFFASCSSVSSNCIHSALLFPHALFVGAFMSSPSLILNSMICHSGYMFHQLVELHPCLLVEVALVMGRSNQATPSPSRVRPVMIYEAMQRGLVSSMATGSRRLLPVIVSQLHELFSPELNDCADGSSFHGLDLPLFSFIFIRDVE